MPPHPLQQGATRAAARRVPAGLRRRLPRLVPLSSRSLHAPVTPARPRRLGIVASRKLGDAVRRNRAKRLIREVFRHQSTAARSAGVDLVVIPRRELFDAPFTDLEQRLPRRLARVPSRDCRRSMPADAAGRLRRPNTGRSACLLALIRGYQLLFSPMYAGSCRFLPSCSQYATEAIQRYGAVRGVRAGGAPADALPPVRRPGFDPVPDSAPSELRRGRLSAINSWKNAFSSRSFCRSWCCTATRRCSRRPSRRSPARRRQRRQAPQRSAASPAAATPAATPPARRQLRTAAPAAPLVARRRRARHRRRERLGARGLHDARRRDQELAAEEVPGRRRASRSNSFRRTRRRRLPLPFTLAVDDAAVSATLAQRSSGRARPSVDASQRAADADVRLQDASRPHRAEGVLVRSAARRTSCTSRRR